MNHEQLFGIPARAPKGWKRSKGVGLFVQRYPPYKIAIKGPDGWRVKGKPERYDTLADLVKANPLDCAPFNSPMAARAFSRSARQIVEDD